MSAWLTFSLTFTFKGKERKALTEQIQQTEQEIDRRLDKLPDILREDGYPDVQAFMLFNAPSTISNYYTALVAHDMAQPDWGKPPSDGGAESL